jgi:hypothetical protein
VHLPFSLVLAVVAVVLACVPGLMLLKMWKAEKTRITPRVGVPPPAVVNQKNELEPVIVPVVPKEENAVPAVNGSANDSAAVAPVVAAPVVLKPLHWAVFLNSDDGKWIDNTIEGMGITIEYQTPYLLVVSILGEDVRRLKAAMAMKFSLLDYTEGTVRERGRKSQLSIFLDKRLPNAGPSPDGTLVSLERGHNATALHWQILMVLSKKEDVIGMARVAGGLLVYETGDLYVFQMPSNEIKSLAGKIGSLQGVSANIDDKALENAITSEKVNLVLYLVEQ